MRRADRIALVTEKTKKRFIRTSLSVGWIGELRYSNLLRHYAVQDSTVFRFMPTTRYMATMSRQCQDEDLWRHGATGPVRGEPPLARHLSISVTVSLEIQHAITLRASKREDASIHLIGMFVDCLSINFSPHRRRDSGEAPGNYSPGEWSAIVKIRYFTSGISLLWRRGTAGNGI